MPAFEEPAFTYAAIEDPKSDLCQGDIIQPTDEVREVLKEVHPHFTDDKYAAFLVLTQTCDLVRRNGKPCKSRYINLAVVRPLRDVLLFLLERACKRVVVGNQHAQGFYCGETRIRAEQLLTRVFNQNAQAEGIFYLHPDESVQIAEPSVALLQVSVAFRSHEHYDRLVEACSGRLKEQFQSKLGWLIGNLFSRVATQDWNAQVKNEMVTAFLEPSDYVGDVRPRWISRGQVQAVKKEKVDITGKSADEIAACLAEHKPVPPKEVAIDRAISLVKEVVAGVSGEQLGAIKDRLASDLIFESACKRA
ncbi:MAG: hypothetical protein K8R91_03190 [Phycisphaerae bacterium]|nr:hypothetical protein [Phycisphaerae bacterium]